MTRAQKHPALCGMCGITLHGGAGVHVGAGVRTQAQARMCVGAI